MKKTAFELVAEAREKHGIELDPGLPRSELIKRIDQLNLQAAPATGETEPKEPVPYPEPEPFGATLFSGKKKAPVDDDSTAPKKKQQ